MSSNTEIAGFREHTGLLIMQEAEQCRTVLRLEDEILAWQNLFVAAGEYIDQIASPEEAADPSALLAVLDQIDVQRVKLLVEARQRFKAELNETRKKLIRSGISVKPPRTRRKL